MEQAILDLDIAAYQKNLIRGIGGEQFNQSLELIRQKGIGGLFIDTDHTVQNFRGCLTFTRAIKNIKNTNVAEALKSDPVELAHNKCLEILETAEPYNIEDDKARAIDNVVKAAAKELSSIRGAMV
jgi:trimethylamine:corrinoid methyltransferase-like protein